MSHNHNEKTSICPDISALPDTLLGNQHQCIERSPKEMIKIAQKLGFSSEELSELERLYDAKPKQ